MTPDAPRTNPPKTGEYLRALVRIRHVAQPQPLYRGKPRRGTQCAFDQQIWPCDAELYRRRLDQAEAALRELVRWAAVATPIRMTDSALNRAIDAARAALGGSDDA